MSSISSNRFGWVRTPSAYQSLQAWHQRQASFRQDFEANQSAAMSAFGDAMSNQISQSGTISAQIALDRIQAAAKAKFAAISDGASATSSTTANPVDPIVLSDGSSTIDVTGGTLTLSNGTVIDLKTGLKVDTTA